jgi:hypothetical protein
MAVPRWGTEGEDHNVEPTNTGPIEIEIEMGGEHPD